MRRKNAQLLALYRCRRHTLPANRRGSTAMSWADIDLKDEKRLDRLVHFYAREGRKCRKAKAHLASCIMFGSALEACLILMVSAYQNEIPANILPAKKRRRKLFLIGRCTICSLSQEIAIGCPLAINARKSATMRSLQKTCVISFTPQES